MSENAPKKPVIEVDDYYDKIHQPAWGRRTAGFLAGTTLGATYGIIMGAIAAFFPYLIAAAGIGASAGAAAAVLPTLATFGATVALYAGVAGMMGFAAQATVGSDAGSIAAGLAEKEKREKIEKARENGISLDDAELRIKETHGAVPKLFSWKAALITVPVLAAFGALISLEPTSASIMVKSLPSLVAGTTEAAIASAGVLGMFGGIIAIKNSYLTNKMANFYHDVLTEKLFAREPEKAVEPVKEVKQDYDVALHMPEQPGKKFATEKVRFSLEALLEKSEERPDRSPTR